MRTKSYFILILIFLLLFTVGCSSSNNADAGNTVGTIRDVSTEVKSNSDKKDNRDTVAVVNTSSESDEQEIRKIMSEAFPVMNSQHMTSNYTQFWDGTELVNWATVIYPYSGQMIFNVKLDNYEVNIFGNTAYTTGYAYGNVTVSDNIISQGPWGFSQIWIKQDDTWKISHFHISKVNLVKFKYLTYLPEGYDRQSQKKWPLVLFLHGMGERGDDLNLIKKHGIPKEVESGRKFPFIAISPQCPLDSTWPMLAESLNSLLDEVVQKYPVDIDRVYLTGLSMGGYGTWSLAMAHPDRFAAIAPISGSGDPSKVEYIKDMPVWAFHGAKDPTVPIALDQAVIDALKKVNNDVKFTVFPDGEHEVWPQVYSGKELYDWLLRYSRVKK